MKKRLLPKIIMILAVTALVLQVSITAAILLKGEAFDRRVIRFISSLVTKPGDLAGVIVGLLSCIIAANLVIIVISIAARRISEICARYDLDSFPMRIMALETKLSLGELTEKEFTAEKNIINMTLEFFRAMAYAAGLIISILKAEIFITLISIIAVILFERIFNQETIIDSFLIYAPLFIANWLLAWLLPILGFIVARYSVVNTYKTFLNLTDCVFNVKTRFLMMG